MSPQKIQHALVLHFQAPPEPLAELQRRDAPALHRLLQCYERAVRHVRKYAGVARLHVVISSRLLEQLREPELIAATRPLIDVPAILEGLRSTPEIEFIGCGYRHAPLPLIPPAEREEQLRNERTVFETVLGRVPKGYVPPADCCSTGMIAILLKAGYHYLLLPHSALQLTDGGAADPYRAYRLSSGKGKEDAIAVVPWDHGFSQSQSGGMEAAWFADAVRDGVAQSPPAAAPYLLTTCSAGDAGEWFCRSDEEQGFWGKFFSPCMEFCETGEYPLQPVLLQEHLHRWPPQESAVLARECTPEGLDREGQLACERLAEVSALYWRVARGKPAGQITQSYRDNLATARALILQAQDSNLLLGDTTARVGLPALLDQAERLLTPASDELADTVSVKPSAKPSAKVSGKAATPGSAATPATPATTATKAARAGKPK